MSFSRTQLRRLAACVLLGWLLAFGVSVAHACGLTPGLAGHPDGANAAHARLGSAADLRAAAANDPTPPVDNPSCIKFCEDSNRSATGSGSVATSAPAHLDSVPLLQPRSDEAARPLRNAWTRDQGQRPARELPIELLRLTL
jgi:hypothetical protein